MMPTTTGKQLRLVNNLQSKTFKNKIKPRRSENSQSQPSHTTPNHVKYWLLVSLKSYFILVPKKWETDMSFGVWFNRSLNIFMPYPAITDILVWLDVMFYH